MTGARSTLLTGLLAAAAAVGAAWAADPVSAAPGSVAPSGPSVSTQAPARAAPVRVAPPTRAEAPPTWAELTAQQQQSLAPLASTWRTLRKSHKAKWLALSANYPDMPAGEQARLHSRMREWAALSPQQRTLARLNFVEAQRVAPDDKRAKWEAYQALSPEEKRKLAAGAPAKPAAPPTAMAVQPVPQQKLTRIPKKKPGTPPRAAVDSNTLLPPAKGASQP